MDVQRESIGELIRQLAGQSANLVRDEVALAKREVNEKVASVGVDVAIMGAGAAVGLVAFMALVAALVIALSTMVGAWQAALGVGLGLLLVAAILVGIGYRRFTSEGLAPTQTIESIEENKAWLKRLT